MGAGDDVEDDDEVEDWDNDVHGVDLEDGDDSEEDASSSILGQSEDLRDQINALKRACMLSVGGIKYASNVDLSVESSKASKQESNEDEFEDDDELLESIQAKYGSSLVGDSVGPGKEVSLHEGSIGWGFEGKEEDDEDEEDDKILRSVEQLYAGDRKNTKTTTSPSPVAVQHEASADSTPHLVDSVSHGHALQDDDDNDSVNVDLQTCQDSPERPIMEIGHRISALLPSNWGGTDEDTFESTSVFGRLANEDGQTNGSLVHVSSETRGLLENAKVVADALAKNRHSQRILRSKLTQIEVKLKYNAELQKQVIRLVEFEKRSNRKSVGPLAGQVGCSIKNFTRKASNLLATSATSRERVIRRNIQSSVAPENSDSQSYEKLHHEVSFSAISRRWTDAERTKLEDGVKQQVYTSLVEQEVAAALDAAEDLEENCESLEDKMSKIASRKLSAREIRDFVPRISWAAVAKMYVTGRSAEECRCRWSNHEDALINHGPWANQEDKRLLNFAQRYEGSNWEDIADKLGTSRTPAKCLMRYQRSLNPNILKNAWNAEADSQLRAAVEELGENDWCKVATLVEGRSSNQCLMRWLKVLHPTKKKRGRWSVEEDKRLMWAVSVYGKRWVLAAQHVPGRTDIQCRERWCNSLDPTLKLGEWTPEEDANLKASVAKHGTHHWSIVAQDMKNRTDNQCWRRWQALHPEDQLAFQRTLHIRRVALRGNFQGRQKERPKLRPEDFISRAADSAVLGNVVPEPATPNQQDTASAPPAGDTLTAPDPMSPRSRRAARIEVRRLARARQLPGRVFQRLGPAPVAKPKKKTTDRTGPNGEEGKGASLTRIRKNRTTKKDSIQTQKQVVSRRRTSRLTTPIIESDAGLIDSAGQVGQEISLGRVDAGLVDSVVQSDQEICLGRVDAALTGECQELFPRNRGRGNAVPTDPLIESNNRAKRNVSSLDVVPRRRVPGGFRPDEVVGLGLESILDFMTCIQDCGTDLSVSAREDSIAFRDILLSRLREALPLKDAGDTFGIDVPGSERPVRGLFPGTDNSIESGLGANKGSSVSCYTVQQEYANDKLGAEYGIHGSRCETRGSPSADNCGSQNLPCLPGNIFIPRQETTSQIGASFATNCPRKEMQTEDRRNCRDENMSQEGDLVADVARELLSPLVSGAREVLLAGTTYLNSRLGATRSNTRGLSSAADERAEGEQGVQKARKPRRRVASAAGTTAAGEQAGKVRRKTQSTGTSAMNESVGGEQASHVRGTKRQRGAVRGTKLGTTESTKRRKMRGAISKDASELGPDVLNLGIPSEGLTCSERSIF